MCYLCIFLQSFDGKKKKRGTRDFNERQKLLHKHKKEMKGARREIKKDNQFLARQKLNEQLEKYVGLWHLNMESIIMLLRWGNDDDDIGGGSCFSILSTSLWRHYPINVSLFY